VAAWEDALRDRRAAIDAFEASVRDAARARIGADLAQIQAQFRADITTAQGDPDRLMEARRAAARSLRSLRPALHSTLRPAVDEGVRLGARLAAGVPPPGLRPLADEGIRQTLLRMNTPIRMHARLSASAVMRLPVRTPAQLEAVIDRIAAVLSEVDAAVSVITTRSVDVGFTAVTNELGVARVWVTRPGCCPVCAEYAGSVALPGQPFYPVASYADGEGQWAGAGRAVSGPPLHRHCRCGSVPDEWGLAKRLIRRTESDVAAGRLAASMAARIRAIDRMLADERRLTQRTRERARRTAARGRGAA
jgi:hypothetical protein